MNRKEFFAKLAPLDDDRLRKVLWNLYWRGPAAMRERIEGELDPVEHARRKQAAAAPASPGVVLDEVREFAELARAGAYLAGDRRVSPKERTRWRVTFRRLAADAEAALRAADPAPAEEALALIIDLACEMKGYQYFRSEDPVEAARFVVSDAATLLWETVRDRHGFGAFAQRAAPQLLPVHHRRVVSGPPSRMTLPTPWYPQQPPALLRCSRAVKRGRSPRRTATVIHQDSPSALQRLAGYEVSGSGDQLRVRPPVP
jgi:uncharacterized protein YfiM (DUF2279 family)